MNDVAHADEIPVIEETWGTLQWLVSGRNGTSTTMTVGRVTIRPGMANPEHYHPNCEEVLFVQQGKIDHSLPSGGVVRLGAGDAIVIPQGIMHQARNAGTEEAVVIVAFNNAWRETVGE